jgi:hypothetical protein
VKLRVLFCFSLTLLLALTIPLCTVSAQSPTTLTEANVRAVVTAMDVATKKASTVGIIAHMAPDIVMEMTVETPAGVQTITLTRDQFAAHTKIGFKRRVAYKQERTINRLTTSKDGKKAMMVSALFESLTLPEGTINAMSDEISIFEVRGGKIMMVSYKVTMRVV